jgi:hypothetical protein
MKSLQKCSPLMIRIKLKIIKKIVRAKDQQQEHNNSNRSNPSQMETPLALNNNNNLRIL